MKMVMEEAVEYRPPTPLSGLTSTVKPPLAGMRQVWESSWEEAAFLGSTPEQQVSASGGAELQASCPHLELRCESLQAYSPLPCVPVGCWLCWRCNFYPNRTECRLGTSVFVRPLIMS